MYFSKFFENFYYASKIESAQVVLEKKLEMNGKSLYGKKQDNKRDFISRCKFLHIIVFYPHRTFGTW